MNTFMDLTALINNARKLTISLGKSLIQSNDEILLKIETQDQNYSKLKCLGKFAVSFALVISSCCTINNADKYYYYENSP